jgi:uncharacterized protein (TIGR02266 family)
MRDFIKRERPKRISLNIPVTYNNLGMFLDSEIMNLSKGGLFLKADICLPLRSQVDFQFALPSEARIIKATGMVVWSRDRKKAQGEASGMGIQFLEISTDDVEAILDYIEKLIKESK